MSSASVFAYGAPHKRKHSPSGYKTYQAFKPWLRDEFVFRCVYCLLREAWHPYGAAGFSVDHIIPQSHNAKLVCKYQNLLYACIACNSRRGSNLVLNPTKEAFANHLRVEQDGTITGLTNAGKHLIDLLYLNKDPILHYRKYILGLLELKSLYPTCPHIDEVYLKNFGYPSDLPDLHGLRAQNKNKGSYKDSYYHLKASGKLPTVY